MKNASRFVSVPLLLVLILIGGARLGLAQAAFSISDSQGTINKFGHTEATGPIGFTVTSGTTISGRFEITYPVPLTNDVGTGITIVGTGGLGASTVSAIPSQGIVVVNVPAGAVTGAKVTLSGVRISAAATTLTAIDATVSSTGNFITVGQNTVRVVKEMLPGMTVTTSTTTFTIVGGLIVDLPPTFTIAEAFTDTFSSAVGVLGQTTPTQVIFQVVGLPDNVTLTFPAIAVSPTTGATLTTQTGLP